MTIYYLVSELPTFDGTGIHRVAKAIFYKLKNLSNNDYNLVAIYGDVDEKFHFSKRYCNYINTDSEPKFEKGDILLSVDLVYDLNYRLKENLQALKKQGIPIYFILYDLIPIQHTEWFHGDSVSVMRDQYLELFKDWVDFICTNSTGIICISKTVLYDLESYLKDNYSNLIQFPILHYFYLGLDIESSSPTRGLPVESNKILMTINSSVSFLMVGTVEPRKGYEKTLNAFEILWKEGIDINLIIVGKKGWLVEELSERILQHEEMGKHLFWLNGISDEYLEKLYINATCLIMASEAEGFGLPIIEASSYKLPIIANNIDIFRELCTTNAFFIKNLEAYNFSNGIKEWIFKYKNNEHPKSEKIETLTWEESALELLQIIKIRSNS
jgi:glycosyltransferase involved in cell wall biosynthesis